jgi:hypothetical protein
MHFGSRHFGARHFDANHFRVHTKEAEIRPGIFIQRAVRTRKAEVWLEDDRDLEDILFMVAAWH